LSPVAGSAAGFRGRVCPCAISTLSLSPPASEQASAGR
jgi:hypothetical protein